MIQHEQIRDLVAEWGLREDVVEKDYVIGWLLWGIASEPVLTDMWVFKGGTCLRKCCFETYRFSEDLDFTVLPGGPIEPDEVEPALGSVLERVAEASGIDFTTRELAVKSRNAPLSTEGRIYYTGPRRAPNPGRIKLDLLGTEQVVRPTVRLPITHPYADELPASADVCCYCLEELFAEKTRALGERCRPRDLYDVIHLYRREDLRGSHEALKRCLEEKCAAKGIDVPTLALINSSDKRAELESEWENMLGHQLPQLPPVESFISALGEFFEWLEGVPVPVAAAPIGYAANEDRSWVPPATVTSWGLRVPLEPIRYAAINRLCVELGYNGTKRVIEPYALRRSREGNLLLYGVRARDRGVRCYRVDRIESVRVTDQTFSPVYAVEFSAAGPVRAKPTTTRVEPSRYSSRRPRRERPGPIYVVQCMYCGRKFRHSQSTTSLRPHKNEHGSECFGRHGTLVATEWP